MPVLIAAAALADAAAETMKMLGLNSLAAEDEQREALTKARMEVEWPASSAPQVLALMQLKVQDLLPAQTQAKILILVPQVLLVQDRLAVERRPLGLQLAASIPQWLSRQNLECQRTAHEMLR